MQKWGNNKRLNKIGGVVDLVKTLFWNWKWLTKFELWVLQGMLEISSWADLSTIPNDNPPLLNILDKQESKSCRIFSWFSRRKKNYNWTLNNKEDKCKYVFWILAIIQVKKCLVIWACHVILELHSIWESIRNLQAWIRDPLEFGVMDHQDNEINKSTFVFITTKLEK